MGLGEELSQSIQCGVNMHDSTGAFSSLNMQVAVDDTDSAQIYKVRHNFLAYELYCDVNKILLLDILPYP